MPECKLIGEALCLNSSGDQTADAPKTEQGPTTLCCRLAEKEDYRTILHIATESPPKETCLSVFANQGKSSKTWGQLRLLILAKQL